MGWIVRLNGKGRIVVPSEVRDKLGLKRGDSLMLDIRGNEIVLAKLDTKAAEYVKDKYLKDFLSKDSTV